MIDVPDSSGKQNPAYKSQMQFLLLQLPEKTSGKEPETLLLEFLLPPGIVFIHLFKK